MERPRTVESKQLSRSVLWTSACVLPARAEPRQSPGRAQAEARMVAWTAEEAIGKQRKAPGPGWRPPQAIHARAMPGGVAPTTPGFARAPLIYGWCPNGGGRGGRGWIRKVPAQNLRCRDRGHFVSFHVPKIRTPGRTRIAIRPLTTYQHPLTPQSISPPDLPRTQNLVPHI